MKSWILSVCCISLFTTVFSLLLPKGKLEKTIKSVFSLLVLFIMLQPLINIKFNDIDLGYIFSSSEIYYQNDFIDYVNREKVYLLENNCQKIIEEQGIPNTKVIIEYTNSNDGQVILEKVFLNFSNSEFIENKEHIYLIDKAKNAVVEYLNVSKEMVVIDE